MGARRKRPRLTRQVVRERTVQDWITGVAQDHGYQWYHVPNSKRTRFSGFPDLVFFAGGEIEEDGTESSCDVFFVEVKGSGGKLTAAQNLRIYQLTKSDIEVHVWTEKTHPDVVISRFRDGPKKASALGAEASLISEEEAAQWVSSSFLSAPC